MALPLLRVEGWLAAAVAVAAIIATGWAECRRLSRVAARHVPLGEVLREVCEDHALELLSLYRYRNGLLAPRSCARQRLQTQLVLIILRQRALRQQCWR